MVPQKEVVIPSIIFARPGCNCLD